MGLYYLVCFLLSIFQLTLSIPLAHAQCHWDEHLALMQFKESLVSTNDHRNNVSDDRCVYPKVDRWKPQVVDCCSWEGVECDQITGHVISLNLSKSCLRGSINSSSSLFRLAHLRELSLAFNNFSYSEIPEALGNLSRLTYLNLSNSLFSGQIPPSISKLSKLSTLDLSLNFGDATGAQGLLELRRPGLKSLLENLTSLTYLDLSLVDVSSQIPSVLANLSSLKSFGCHNCKLLGKFPEAVFNLPNLELIDVSRNYDLTGHLPEFYSSNKVKVLSFWMSSFGGEVPASIGNLQSLEYLGLSHCKFEGLLPSSLRNLTNITHLSLENNSFVGEFPSFLSNLTNLKFLALGHNQYGSSEIPSSLAKLIHLQRLDLAQSSLTGSFPTWLTNMTQLRFLDLGFNGLQGQLPRSLSRLKNLKYLDLASNNLTGQVELDSILKFKDLKFLRLSDNKLSVLSSEANPNASVPKLVKLKLASCNLTSFPGFLRYQERLQSLDLSFNGIHGNIPKWLLEMSKKTLLVINLSNNYLTTFEEPPLILHWTNLIYLNIASNMLQGSLLIPPLSTSVYIASNNSLIGEIPPLICNLTSLQVLDVSYNNLTGEIPQCFASLSKSLKVLNLYGNNFFGPIPRIWSNGSKLHLINLGHNKFDGRVPRSIALCTMLQYLDLGDNQIEDTFPSWLGVLNNLTVLILRSNRFLGTIAPPESDSAFSKLHIIDLSNNEFTGLLPSEHFKTWNAMRNLSEESSMYMHFFDIVISDESNFLFRNVYNYSMTLTNKGVDTKFPKVLEVFTVVDLSSNRFQGEIPDSIGSLKGLQALNLSNNLLTRDIPLVMGSLSELEALDLSCNKLTGRIPWQLRQLNFLAVFNVSNNRLIGPIPQGGQFNTFDNSSFGGNLGLCGNPTSRKCEDDQSSSSSSTSDEDLGHPFFQFGWKALAIGYGFGMVIGVIIGQITITRKHDWFIKVFEQNIVVFNKLIRWVFRLRSVKSVSFV